MKLLSDKLDQLVTKQALDLYPRLEPAWDLEMELTILPLDELAAGAGGDSNLAQCALSGLWLLYGFLDQSHLVSQSIPTAEGSFWHAIMHRLEKDFWNSKYWYRQVGRHDVFESMNRKLRIQKPESKAVGWSPEDFVDQCEAAEHRTTAELVAGQEMRERLQQIAKIEWSSLFQFCLPKLDANWLSYEGQ